MSNKEEQAAARPERNKQDLWTEKKVRQLLRELDQSGESVAAFAQRRGFTAQRLHWWMSKLGWKRTQLPVAGGAPPAQAPSPSSAAAPPFVPVRVVPAPQLRPVCSPGRPAGVIIEVGSRQIRLEDDFDEQVLCRVVRLLEQVPSC